MALTGVIDRLRRFRPDDRRACLVAYALLAIWCFPLYAATDTRGGVMLDWEWFLAYYEALRTTLLDHGQLPGFNPWMYLGTPLWANPQVGPLSHFTPLVLLFGPVYGMKLGIVASYVISFETARLLGRALFRSPIAPVVAGLLYALNAPLASQWVLGQICFSAFALAPLLPLFCLKLPTWRWAGAAAGAVTGAMVHYGVHYYLIYVVLLCALLTVAVAHRERAWRLLPRFAALFVIALLAVAATRILPILAVMHDFPREIHPRFALQLETLWRMFLVPTVGPPVRWLQIVEPPMLFQLSSCEFHAYPGLLTIGLALASLRWRLRFYHVGALLALLLMLGNHQPWHLSRWLALLPPFDSMWVVVRWRMVVVACLAFAAARTIDQLISQRSADPDSRTATPATARPWRPRIGRLLAWAAPLEVLALLLPSWSASVCPYRDRPLTRAQIGLPQTAWMLSVKQIRTRQARRRVYFSLFRANVGTAAGYDPLFGYLPARSARAYWGHPRYRGEFVVDGAAVAPARWSPNQLRFEHLPAGRRLEVNLNPGPGWSLNGRPLFASMKLFALQRRFVVRIPASGAVVLDYRPPGLAAGFWLSLACGLSLLGYALLVARGRRASS